MTYSKINAKDKEIVLKVYQTDRSAFNSLLEIKRMVLTERFLSPHPKTLAEIGKAIGRSKERVRQIEHHAVRKLQRAFDRRKEIRKKIPLPKGEGLFEKWKKLSLEEKERRHSELLFASRINPEQREIVLKAYETDRSAFDSLPERERMILTERFLSSKPKTRVEIGKVIGRSVSTVNQIEYNAVRKLQRALCNKENEERLLLLKGEELVRAAFSGLVYTEVRAYKGMFLISRDKNFTLRDLIKIKYSEEEQNHILHTRGIGGKSFNAIMGVINNLAVKYPKIAKEVMAESQHL